MKFWKTTLLSVFGFLAVSATVLVSSCEKDACTELKCKNGSACTEGFCRCATGFEGSECEFKTVNRFIGTYYGYNHRENYPPMLDTLDVYFYANPNVVEFRLHNYHPEDRYRGTVDGYTITVPDETQGNSLRKVNAVVDHEEMTVFIERNENVDRPDQRSISTFIGSKK